MLLNFFAQLSDQALRRLRQQLRERKRSDALDERGDQNREDQRPK